MYLVIWKDTCVSYTVDVAVDFPFQIWHSPAKVDEKKSNTQYDFQASSRQIRPIAHIGKSEALHNFVQIFHVLAGKRIHIFPSQRIFNQQLVKLLDFITRSESSGKAKSTLLELCKLWKIQQNEILRNVQIFHLRRRKINLEICQ